LLIDIAEHVFEGQLIGDFFSHWLDEGKIDNQLPMPSSPQPKWSCGRAIKYVFEDEDWEITNTNGKRIKAPFFMVLLRELGSAGHLDRLTIFKARANGMKGGVRSGSPLLQREILLTKTTRCLEEARPPIRKIG
jgi:chitinase